MQRTRPRQTTVCDRCGTTVPVTKTVGTADVLFAAEFCSRSCRRVWVTEAAKGFD